MRPGYTPLPRTSTREAPYPSPPPGCAALAVHPALARVAQRLNITLAEVDARLSVEDVLDECDLQAYLYDVDCEPPKPPAPTFPAMMRR